MTFESSSNAVSVVWLVGEHSLHVSSARCNYTKIRFERHCAEPVQCAADMPSVSSEKPALGKQLAIKSLDEMCTLSHCETSIEQYERTSI